MGVSRPYNGSGRQVGLGVVASLVAGTGAIAIAVASKALVERGWSRRAVLAHRFYLILPLALLLTLHMEIDPAIWTLPFLGTISAVAVLGVGSLINSLPPVVAHGIRRLCDHHDTRVRGSTVNKCAKEAVGRTIEQALNPRHRRRRGLGLFRICVKSGNLRATNRLESIA